MESELFDSLFSALLYPGTLRLLLSQMTKKHGKSSHLGEEANVWHFNWLSEWLASHFLYIRSLKWQLEHYVDTKCTACNSSSSAVPWHEPPSDWWSCLPRGGVWQRVCPRCLWPACGSRLPSGCRQKHYRDTQSIMYMTVPRTQTAREHFHNQLNYYTTLWTHTSLICARGCLK